MSHPFEGSWGYQVTGYFAPDARFGTPDDFRHLVEALHAEGIGVILDWVPGHFPKDDWALGRFDGTALYEHADPRQGEQQDWGTYVFNFGRNEVKCFLVSNALYWVHQFHVDALRVDAVASMLYLDYSREEGQWVPNQYGGRENLEAIDLLRYVNKHLYERVPGVTMIAEESTSFGGVTKPVHHGGLGFGFKWNMGWMNDSLRYLGLDPVYRQYHHNDMTFAMVYAYSENFILPISHDEVVHGKGSMLNKIPQETTGSSHAAGVLRLHVELSGKQLLFMGQEFAQRRSGTRRPAWSGGSTRCGANGVRQLIKRMNELQAEHPPLYELDSDPAGFSWMNADDAGHNTYSFVRADRNGQLVACITNFSPEPYPSYPISVRRPACGSRSSTPTRRSSTGPAGSTIPNRSPPPHSRRPRTPGPGRRWPSRRWPRSGCVTRADPGCLRPVRVAATERSRLPEKGPAPLTSAGTGCSHWPVDRRQHPGAAAQQWHRHDPACTHRATGPANVRIWPASRAVVRPPDR